MPTKVSLYMRPDASPSTWGSNSIRSEMASNAMVGRYINFLCSDPNSYPCGRIYTGIETGRGIQYASSYVSNANCVFENVPWVRFTYGENVTSRFVTVFYRGAWLKPHKVRVTWLDENDVQMAQREYTMDEATDEGIQGGSSTFQVYENYVENFRKVKVEFLESWLPNQSIYMVDVSLGDVASFDADVILSAEADIISRGTSDTLDIGTATITILDSEGLFNPQNIDGRWQDLGERESLVLSEYDDNNDIVLQTFWYLDTFDWENDVLTLNAMDCIGIMEKDFFPGVDYDEATYSPTLQDLLGRLHDFTRMRATLPSGWSDYTFNRVIMENGTCKDYLQNIMFACGYEVRRHFRRNYYHMVNPNSAVRDDLYPNRKFNSRLTFDEQTNGITIEVPTSDEVGESEVFLSQYFDVGKYLVTFDGIYRSISISGATDITGAVRNTYRRIQVDSAGTVTFTGKKVTLNYTSYSEPIIEKSDENSFKNFRTFVMCDARKSHALDVLRQHYSNRQLMTIEAQLRYGGGYEDANWNDLVSDMPGKWCKVEDVKGLTAYARIEKVHVDFVGGMLGEIELRGYSRQVVDNLRMVEDDYTMEDNPLM